MEDTPRRSIQIVPGALTVHEYWHEVQADEAVPCWTYVTEGLEAHGQQEIVFTFRQDPEMAENGETPDFLLRVIERIFGLAQRGQTMDAGGFVTMTFTNAQRTVNIPFNLLYLPPVPLPGVAMPSPALTVRLMGPAEMKVYEAYGAARLMSAWAYDYRYFPYPPWSEMPAQNTVSLKRFEASVLNQVSRLPLLDSTVSLEGDEIVLRLRPQARESLARHLHRLPPLQGVALLPNFDPQANAGLVWLPAENETVLNATPQSPLTQIAGCFVLFIPEASAAATRVAEDGFAVRLPPDQWTDLREAMLTGRSFTLAASTMQFRLEHI